MLIDFAKFSLFSDERCDNSYFKLMQKKCYSKHLIASKILNDRLLGVSLFNNFDDINLIATTPLDKLNINKLLLEQTQ